MHGEQGIGKDAVATEVVLRDEITDVSRDWELCEWLPGSSDEQFRRHLLLVFEAQYPELFPDSSQNNDAKLDVIKVWLRTNRNWLFVVEDAPVDNTALTEFFPATNEDKGFLLITSQHNLQDEMKGMRVTCNIKLPPLQPEDALAIYKDMKVFSGKALRLPKTEQELKDECGHHSIAYVGPAPLEKPGSDAQNKRQNDMRKQLLEQEEDDLKAQVGAGFI